MSEYINDIREIIFKYLQNEYKNYINNKKILCIKKNEVLDVISNLYNNTFKELKLHVRNEMHNKYPVDYPKLGIENIILDLFQNKEDNIIKIANEINFIQNENLLVVDFPIINNSLNLNICNSEGYIIINYIKDDKNITKETKEIYDSIIKYKFIYSINDKILDDFDEDKKINIIKKEIENKTNLELGVYYLKSNSE
tara:strand:+ start:3296 stop:3886 length:591 start_codon:yes stop_codon:yes gene_type:complete